MLVADAKPSRRGLAVEVDAGLAKLTAAAAVFDESEADAVASLGIVSKLDRRIIEERCTHGLNLVTPMPTACTTPTPSWPIAISLSIKCRSVAQRPLWVIFIATSFGSRVVLLFETLPTNLPSFVPLSTRNSVGKLMVFDVLDEILDFKRVM